MALEEKLLLNAPVRHVRFTLRAYGHKENKTGFKTHHRKRLEGVAMWHTLTSAVRKWVHGRNILSAGNYRL